MMWIIPKQLHTSPSAPGTAELISDSSEFCQLCEHSLTWRSKGSPARTWLQRWKRESWMRHLSGRTLKPAIGESFVTGWISSVADIRVNHSQQPGSAKGKATPATSGLSYRGQLGLFDQDSASLRMSKDILPSALKTSATTWESWVTSLRQEYSARLKSAHLIRGKECSSWPTVAASEARQGYQNRNNGKRGSQKSLTTVVIETGPPAQENPSTSGKSQELWATPDTMTGPHGERGISTNPNHQSYNSLAGQAGRAQQNWPTAVSDSGSGGPHGLDGGSGNRKKLMRMHPEMRSAKLNSNWVEQLMGLPVGWTQLPTEWIVSGFSATESSPPPAK